jgi:hypothetical protein
MVAFWACNGDGVTVSRVRDELAFLASKLKFAVTSIAGLDDLNVTCELS